MKRNGYIGDIIGTKEKYDEFVMNYRGDIGKEFLRPMV
jgi:hypothetical protein